MSQSESVTLEPEAHGDYGQEDSLEWEVECGTPLDGVDLKANMRGVGRAAKDAGIQLTKVVAMMCTTVIVLSIAVVARAVATANS